MNIATISGVRVLEVPSLGPPLGSEQDALDLIGEAYGNDVDLFAIPVARLHPDFLQLRTTMAGLFLQKLQNYGFRCAIVGDISADVAASTALADFVRESNRIGRMLFASDRDDLERRLVTR